MQKVYIETSVLSYYTSNTSRDIVIAGHQISTINFWNKLIANELIPVISALVIKEASQGDIEIAKKREMQFKVFLCLIFQKKRRNCQIY